MSNYVKAVLILNAKKKSSKKCPECGSMMKNGECPECDSEEMTENAKKGGKSKGWTDSARKKAAATRKRKKSGKTISAGEAMTKFKLHGETIKTLPDSHPNKSFLSRMIQGSKEAVAFAPAKEAAKRGASALKQIEKYMTKSGLISVRKLKPLKLSKAGEKFMKTTSSDLSKRTPSGRSIQSGAKRKTAAEKAREKQKASELRIKQIQKKNSAKWGPPKI